MKLRVLLAIAAAITATATTAASLELRAGETARVDCNPGPTPPNPNPGPDPTPPPSNNCPDPSMPFQLKTLEYGKDKKGIVLNAGRAIVYKFNPKNLRNGITAIAIGPHWAQGASAPSNMNTMTISRCPTDFDVGNMPRSCYGSGGQSTINVSVDAPNVGSCVVTTNPPGLYYLSITPANPMTGRSPCKGNCGAILSVR